MSKKLSAPCPIHGTVRADETGKCIQCAQDARTGRAPPPTCTPEMAQYLGYTKYMGAECPRHHIKVRYSANGDCVRCMSEWQSKTVRAANRKKKWLEAKAKWVECSQACGDIALLTELYGVVTINAVKRRLEAGWDMDRALSTPSRKTGWFKGAKGRQKKAPKYHVPQGHPWRKEWARAATKTRDQLKEELGL